MDRQGREGEGEEVKVDHPKYLSSISTICTLYKTSCSTKIQRVQEKKGSVFAAHCIFLKQPILVYVKME